VVSAPCHGTQPYNNGYSAPKDPGGGVKKEDPTENRRRLARALVNRSVFDSRFHMLIGSAEAVQVAEFFFGRGTREAVPVPLFLGERKDRRSSRR
jgi:hypothetical protein